MKSRLEDTLKLVATLATVILFLWLSRTSQIQNQILGVVFLALVIWSLYPERHFESSILIILLLSFFQISLNIDEFINSLFTTYGSSGLWIILSGFVLAKAMEKSGISRRIALWIVTSIGGNPNNIVFSVAIANLAVAPLSPSTTAKAYLLLPICISLIEVFGVEKGRSKYGIAVMLMAMAANNICSTAFLTATVPNPISDELIRAATGVNLGWFGWFRMAFPLTLLLLIISWFICISIYRPEIRETSETYSKISDLKEEIGPLNRSEKIVVFFFAVSLVLWITDDFHGLNAGLISFVLSLILFLPRFGVMKVQGFAGDVPWGSITLFAASMFLAKALSQWSVLDPLAQNIFRFLKLSNMESATFLITIVIISMFLHVVFTSTTVYATVMVPLVISLTQLQGLKTQVVALPVAFLTPIAVILPVNTIPNIVFYSSGYFNHKQIIIYGSLISLISIILIILIGLPYWKLLGLI